MPAPQPNKKSIRLCSTSWAQGLIELGTELELLQYDEYELSIRETSSDSMGPYFRYKF